MEVSLRPEYSPPVPAATGDRSGAINPAFQPVGAAEVANPCGESDRCIWWGPNRSLRPSASERRCAPLSGDLSLPGTRIRSGSPSRAMSGVQPSDKAGRFEREVRSGGAALGKSVGLRAGYSNGQALVRESDIRSAQLN